jgi:hypothetical protein
MPGEAGEDDVARDAPKCANVGCNKLGLHRCGGCKGMMYCSAACQKVHWEQGGHKQECKKTPTSAAAAMGQQMLL